MSKESEISIFDVGIMYVSGNNLQDVADKINK